MIFGPAIFIFVNEKGRFSIHSEAENKPNVIASARWRESTEFFPVFCIP